MQNFNFSKKYGYFFFSVDGEITEKFKLLNIFKKVDNIISPYMEKFKFFELKCKILIFQQNLDNIFSLYIEKLMENIFSLYMENFY